MPDFIITAPDGKKYKVSGPDQSGAVAALKKMLGVGGKMKTAEGAAASPPMATLDDVAKAAGSGLVTGSEFLAGMPGDVADAAISSADWLRTKATGGQPMPPEARASLRRSLPVAGLFPTSGEVSSTVSRATGFKPYEAKTPAGQFANAAAEFIPGAVAFGGGTGVRGVVDSAIRYGVVPGVASEAAGQVTQGTPFEPWARTAAAVTAGGAGALLKRGSNVKAAQKMAPTAADLQAQARPLYKAVDAAGITVTPNAFGKMVDNIAIDTWKSGARPKIQPKAFEAIKELLKAKNAGAPQTFSDIDLMRQVAVNALEDASKNERRVAGMILRGIDDFMAGLTPADIAAGTMDPQQAAAMLKQARDYWRVSTKAKIIERIFFKAENATAANYTSAGMQTALRQRFRALSENEALFSRFSPDEQKAILRVVRGGPVENAMRMLGKYAPKGVLSGYGAVGVTALGGPLLGGAFVAGTTGARAASTAAGLRNARAVDLMVRGGGKAPPAAFVPQTLGLPFLYTTPLRSQAPIAPPFSYSRQN